MGVLDQLKSVFSRRRIESRNDALAFLESRAAFVAQKSLTEYAQARANMMFSSLLREKGFQEAYDVARWRAYPATLSMVAEVLAGALRDRLGASAKTATAVTEALVADVVAKMRGHGPLTDREWDAAVMAVSADLARASMGAPHEAHAIARARAKEVFDALPFHPAIKQHDFGMFSNTLAFHMTEIATELEQSRLERGVLEGSA
jgi:hypothetical protein